MARLTKADAARQLGISRATLYKLIDQGAISATPDGLIDSTELVREAAQERERAYREHIAHLTVMLDQAHQQNQRLLEAPRSVPSPTMAAPPVPSAETTGGPARDVSPGRASFPNRSAARQRILALLQ